MRYKLISCEVFSRPAFLAAANSQHIIDMEFTKLRSHLKPGSLREEIQSIIDRTTEYYDAVLLGYGLCGNSTAGLTARSLPLVIPRAHDCCTIFLGSRSAFVEHFGQTPSAQWSTTCYYERSDGWYSDNTVNILSPGTRFLEGSTRLIEKLIAGDWDDEEFLLVPPGAEIKPIYDHDRIMGL